MPSFGSQLFRFVPLLSSPTDGKTLPNSRKRESARCFLRVQENTFSGAAYGLSTPKRADERLFRPIVNGCSAGSSLRAEWDSVPRPAGALPQTPPRATAPLDGRNALRGLVYNFVQPRRITIVFPALCCLRRS